MEKWYDERYYLKDENYFVCKPIHDMVSMNRFASNFNEIRYSNLYDKYTSFIKKASLLVDVLSLEDNFLSMILVISYLIHDGIFSINEKFEGNSEIDDFVYTKLGINVLYGIGCCRHVSSFVNEIMDALDIPCEMFPCVTIYDDDVEACLIKKATHLANLIYYEENPYVFDAYNGNSLFKFDNEFLVSPINRKYAPYLYYKPYWQMCFCEDSLSEIKAKLEFYKQSVGRHITESELNQIILSTELNFERQSDIILDFEREVRNEKQEINELIKEIKK